MRSSPLPPVSVLLVGVDVRVVRECVRFEVERLRGAGGAVPSRLGELVAVFDAALDGAEVPAEVPPLPVLVTVDVPPAHWVCATDAVRDGLVPVSREALGLAARRGRVGAVKCRGRLFFDPEELEATTWRPGRGPEPRTGQSGDHGTPSR